MTFRPDEAAALICNADSIRESIDLYWMYRKELRGWKFILATENGQVPGFAVHRQFANGAEVFSLFKTDKVLVLDDITAMDMSAGQATYAFDYSIALDTQAFSYVEPYLSGNRARLPGDFSEVFEFIARDDVNVDPIPYMLENQENLTKAADNPEKIFRKLKGYEVLRSIDYAHLKATGEVRSTLSEAQLTRHAQELIARMLYNTTDRHTATTLKTYQKVMYSLLLKMVELQLGKAQRTAAKKITAFLEFLDEELASIFARECVIARAYFERGQHLPFFDKIQIKADGIFRALDSMAWDLWHLRQTEQALTLSLTREARYFFPALLTFDKRLIEVAHMYPLKACAISPGAHAPIPFYAGEWLKEIARDCEGGEDELFRRFYSDSAIESRNRRRSSDLQFVDALTRTLEERVSAISQVPVPRDKQQPREL
jgi:hypothetical protein